jgi:glycerol-3-phosphate cytidylyltransferase-like family protein
MSKEFVDTVVAGNNIDAETAFKKSMATKVGDALEVKRKELSANFVKSVYPEESDEDT